MNWKKCNSLYILNKINKIDYILFILFHAKNCNMRLSFFVLIGFTFCLSACKPYTSEYISIEPLGIHPNGTVYIGMESCTQCHLDIVNAHKETAHWLTSSKLTSIKANSLLKFKDNFFELSDQTRVNFELKGDTLFQEAFEPPYSSPFFKKPININIGSGSKIGNSFLSWEASSLFQLQGSYYHPKSKWINSPGYPPFFQPFRPIYPRCLECHTTYSQSENWQSNIPTNRYNKENIVFGIDCQRCHGDVIDHVKYHRENPMDSIGRKIISYSTFTQKQRIDMCALCHSGVGKNINQPAFSFRPGDDLNLFLAIDTSKDPDVHSNQVSLLKNSSCYINSKAMDCMTCHDPHSNEKNETLKFNAYCIQCHSSPKHNNFSSEGYENCISCHMPLKASNLMKIQYNKDSISPVWVRTHRIGIYSEGELEE